MGIYILPSFAVEGGGEGDLKKKNPHRPADPPPPCQSCLFIPTYWLSEELDSARVCVYSQTLSSSRPRLAEPTKIIAPEKEELDRILFVLLITFTETLRRSQKSNRMLGNSAKDKNSCAFPSATANICTATIFFFGGCGGLRRNSSSAAEEGAVRGGALDACWRLVAISVSNMEIPFVRCIDSVPRRLMVFKSYYSGFTRASTDVVVGSEWVNCEVWQNYPLKCIKNPP